MSEPFLGQIMIFGGNFAPRGWAFCNGQLLSIAQNSALFSLLGTTYGGDGVTTFGLPDLRGRVPMHWGQGPGLTNRVLGESSGSETVTLLSTQIPAHNHLMQASTTDANQASPANNICAPVLDSQGAAGFEFSNAAPNATMNPAAIAASGGSQPHENLQPYLCLSFVIALEGLFPSRN
jgi:microcystin-dependent protein